MHCFDKNTVVLEGLWEVLLIFTGGCASKVRSSELERSIWELLNSMLGLRGSARTRRHYEEKLLVN